MNWLLGVLIGAAGLPFWVVGARAMGESMAGRSVPFGTKLLVLALFSLKSGTLAWAVSVTRGWTVDANRGFALGLVSVYSAFVGWAALRKAD